MDCSPPGSSVHGILQARILQWVAIPFSRGSSPPRDRTWFSSVAVRFFTVEPPGKPHYSVLKILSLLMGFSRQEYWSGLPFPSPVDHSLSELSTMTLMYWVALHGMVHSFIDLDKAVIHVISLLSFLWLWFSFCPALWCIRIRKLQ